MPNKTEIIKWFVDHIFEAADSQDLAVEDIWALTSAIIAFYKRETPEHRNNVLYDLRAVVKTMLAAERKTGDHLVKKTA